MSQGSLAKCAKKIDATATIDAAVDNICGCFGDLSCSCAILEQFAGQCDAAGINTASWILDNKETVCAVDCEGGATFRALGPKPPPSCKKPKGGKKSMKGCYCPEDKVMEEGECIDVAECTCENEGIRYDIGGKYTDEGKCLVCTCVGPGKVDCVDKKCNTKCKANEIEVVVEGKCCPVCQEDWVEAVNPKPEGVGGESLELTCKVTGVEVTAEDIFWVMLNPTTDVAAIKKHYEVSADGLTLTIKKLNEKRAGNYKCIVEKDGKKSEGNFEVAMPIVQEDLIEAVEETVNFFEGRELTLQVNKLEKNKITELYWECNGERMDAGTKGIRIVNKGAFSKLIIESATLDDIGSCTCHVKGVGVQDSATIEITGQTNEVTLRPVVEEVTCNQGKKCVIRFSAEKDKGKIAQNKLKVCRLEGEKLKACKAVKKVSGKYVLNLGGSKAAHAGQYVAVYTEGEETRSVPVTVTYKAKGKKGE